MGHIDVIKGTEADEPVVLFPHNGKGIVVERRFCQPLFFFKEGILPVKDGEILGHLPVVHPFGGNFKVLRIDRGKVDEISGHLF